MSSSAVGTLGLHVTYTGKDGYFEETHALHLVLSEHFGQSYRRVLIHLVPIKPLDQGSAGKRDDREMRYIASIQSP